MAKIKILPEILSNKIAAGEVVERPASVVKELLENAIDAQSTRIVVDVENGGRNLIRISDNGIGMGRDDALLAIERYATSKITDDSDLFNISTLGFRGEAIPSIASVSRFDLVTRSRDADVGTNILIEGGKIKDVTDIGAPPGTMISVRSLFYNTPARRKFLKTVNTEMGHIGDTVASVALGWPDIQFKLRHNGRVVKSWGYASEPFDRVVDVLGRELRGDLHKMEYNDGYLDLAGWISSADVTRSTSQKIHLYVNGRHVRDRGLIHALGEGYRGRLMKGRFPMAVIYMNLPCDQVDVNVHPTKHEIRFADHRRVYTAIKNEALKALAKSESLLWKAEKHIDGNDGCPATEEKTKFPDSPVKDSVNPLSAGEKKADAAYEYQTDEKTPSSGTYGRDAASVSIDTEQYAERSTPAEAVEKQSVSPLSARNLPSKPAKRTDAIHEQETLWEKSFFQDLKVIGQFHNTYILCESDAGLILLDQHAAHERVRYEALKKNRERRGPGSVQRLLMPETIELNYREAAVLEQMIPDLSGLGLEVENFGDNSFVIRSVPALLSEADIKPILADMVDMMVQEGYSPGIGEAIDECLILMACHGSIRANHRLAPQEISLLMKQLDSCENPSHCPHGRPTWVKWDLKFIEKSFNRIV